MNTTIRNRAAALGIAAVAGVATVGLASGPALASTSSETTTTAQKSPSEEFPTNPVDYADDFVSAYGVGDKGTVAELANDTAYTALYAHHHPHADRWDRKSSHSRAGTTHAVYTNVETKGRLTVSVNNETASHGEEDAVTSIEFVSQEGEY